MAKQLAAREVESRYELDVVRPKKPLPLTPNPNPNLNPSPSPDPSPTPEQVRFKKQQLREIKRLLAKPSLLDRGGSDDPNPKRP